jgi:hypothetical protein
MRCGCGRVVLTNSIRIALRLKEIDLELLTDTVDRGASRLDIDRMMISLDGQRRVDVELEAISKEPDDLSRITQAAALLKLLFKLKLTLNLWHAQNRRSDNKPVLRLMERRAKHAMRGGRWLAPFSELCLCWSKGLKMHAAAPCRPQLNRIRILGCGCAADKRALR